MHAITKKTRAILPPRFGRPARLSQHSCPSPDGSSVMSQTLKLVQLRPVTREKLRALHVRPACRPIGTVAHEPFTPAAGAYENLGGWRDLGYGRDFSPAKLPSSGGGRVRTKLSKVRLVCAQERNAFMGYPQLCQGL